MNLSLPIETKHLKFNHIYLSTIQSLVVIATALAYYFNSNHRFISGKFQFGLIILPAIAMAIIITRFFKGEKQNLKPWHYLIAFSVLAFVFNYETNVNAQILEGIDGAITDVGTAAGGSFAATVLEAVIELIRIAVYIAVAGAVIAGIIFGVTQGQWQAPVMVVGVIVGIGLFLEIMGEVVFG